VPWGVSDGRGVRLACAVSVGCAVLLACGVSVGCGVVVPWGVRVACGVSVSRGVRLASGVRLKYVESVLAAPDSACAAPTPACEVSTPTIVRLPTPRTTRARSAIRLDNISSSSCTSVCATRGVARLLVRGFRPS
jgi:hypothetical protein